MFEFRRAQSVKQVLPLYGIFVGWLAVTFFGLYLRPSESGHATHMQLGLPPCGSVALFGRPCPGCGLTTSWTALLHGNWGHSIAAHPFGPALFMAFTVICFTILYAALTRNTFSFTRLGSVTVGIGLAVYVAFGVVRFLSPPAGYPASSQYSANKSLSENQ